MFYLRLKVLFSVFLFATSVKAHDLTLGVFPYLDSASLVRIHQPLKQAIEKELNLSVRFISAPNFKTFIQNTHAGKYDIVITAPHLGRMAQKKAGYQWLGFSSNRSYAVFVVNKDNTNIKSLADIQHLDLALPPQRAIIHQLALNKVKDLGFTEDKLQVHATASHNTALQSVVKGVTRVGAFGLPTWKRYQKTGQQTLKQIGTSESIPGFAYMVKKEMSVARKAKLRNLFLTYDESQAGQHYFETAGLDGSRAESPADFKQLDFYIEKIKAAVAK